MKGALDKPHKGMEPTRRSAPLMPGVEAVEKVTWMPNQPS
jgi:hypothetical protein